MERPYNVRERADGERRRRGERPESRGRGDKEPRLDAGRRSAASSSTDRQRGKQAKTATEGEGRGDTQGRTTPQNQVEKTHRRPTADAAPLSLAPRHTRASRRISERRFLHGLQAARSPSSPLEFLSPRSSPEAELSLLARQTGAPSSVSSSEGPLARRQRSGVACILRASPARSASAAAKARQDAEVAQLASAASGAARGCGLRERGGCGAQPRQGRVEPPRRQEEVGSLAVAGGQGGGGATGAGVRDEKALTARRSSTATGRQKTPNGGLGRRAPAWQEGECGLRDPRRSREPKTASEELCVKEEQAEAAVKRAKRRAEGASLCDVSTPAESGTLLRPPRASGSPTRGGSAPSGRTATHSQRPAAGVDRGKATLRATATRSARASSASPLSSSAPLSGAAEPLSLSAARRACTKAPEKGRVSAAEAGPTEVAGVPLEAFERFQKPFRRVELTELSAPNRWKKSATYEEKIQSLLQEGVARSTCFRREAPSSLTICKQYDWKNHQAMFEDEDRTMYYRKAICWRGWERHEAARAKSEGPAASPLQRRRLSGDSGAICAKRDIGSEEETAETEASGSAPRLHLAARPGARGTRAESSPAGTDGLESPVDAAAQTAGYQSEKYDGDGETGEEEAMHAALGAPQTEEPASGKAARKKEDPRRPRAAAAPASAGPAEDPEAEFSDEAREEVDDGVVDVKTYRLPRAELSEDQDAGDGKRPRRSNTYVQGKRILEIGTGPIALLAVLAVKAGADYVDALEVSRTSASLATAFIRQFGLNASASRYRRSSLSLSSLACNGEPQRGYYAGSRRGAAASAASLASPASPASSSPVSTAASAPFSDASPPPTPPPAVSAASSLPSPSEALPPAVSCAASALPLEPLQTSDSPAAASICPSRSLRSSFAALAAGSRALPGRGSPSGDGGSAAAKAAAADPPSPLSSLDCARAGVTPLPSPPLLESFSPLPSPVVPLSPLPSSLASASPGALRAAAGACEAPPPPPTSAAAPRSCCLRTRPRSSTSRRRRRSPSPAASRAAPAGPLVIHSCYSKLFPLPPPHLAPKPWGEAAAFPLASTAPALSQGGARTPPAAGAAPRRAARRLASPPSAPLSATPARPPACYYEMIIHEILGDFASQEGAADVYLDIQRRLGYCPRSIPTAATTCVAPCTFPTRENVPYQASEHPERTIFSPRRRLFQSVGLQFSSLLLCDALLPMEQLRFEEPMERQMLQRRRLEFTVTRAGKFAGFVAGIDVEIRPGRHFGTVFERQCDSWYTNIVLLGKEIDVRRRDRITLFTVADLKNYQLDTVSHGVGKKKQAVQLEVSRPTYTFQGFVERKDEGVIAEFGPVLIDYDEQASCVRADADSGLGCLMATLNPMGAYLFHRAARATAKARRPAGSEP
ncbi:hypothetical protein BESB_033460 [Besnoitia besnoiti]|uniref:Uncharacterized protein n=1 Tax=Besnoitia besnoiti TaxID=94643 RepID=A0A2A9MEE2_BESBE|nr:hypothetical protein BESB_033460 [Besnoitia besnoiti]PFH36888.1 hypothetical protein BESB_033460 [Besnoitia besnoiti]